VNNGGSRHTLTQEMTADTIIPEESVLGRLLTTLVS